MRTWIYKETGETDYPGKTWFFDGYRVRQDYDDSMVYRKYPILSLTVCESDPLEPIQKVYEEFKGRIQADGSGPWRYEKKLWLAINEAMKRCNAKDVKAE